MNNSVINKKEILLKEAFILFLDRGFEGVSVDDIVEATNKEHEISISKSLAFHYFKNKNQFFKDAVDKYIFDPLADRPMISEKLADESQPLKTFLQIYLNRIRDRMQGALDGEGRIQLSSRNYFRIFISLKDHYPEVEEKLMEYEIHENNLWITILSIALRANEIKRDTDVQQMAFLFIHVYYGVSFKQSLHEGLTVKDLEKQWMWLYDHIKVK